jgi:hypothetical protein
MNKCYLQLWEQSSTIENISIGCSIHLDLETHYNFIDEIYSTREELLIPEYYDRIVSMPFECFISDELYQNLLTHKNIRLSEVEKSNLSKFQDLITKI